MKTATVAGICAVLLVLAGFSLSHLQARNHELTRSISTLRLQVKAQEAAIEVHEQALKEAEENARERQAAMEEALHAAGVWSDQQLPDSVRWLLDGTSACRDFPPPRRSDGADSNSRPDKSKDARRLGTALN